MNTFLILILTSDRLIILNAQEKEFAAGHLLVAVARGPRRSTDPHFSPSQIMNASSKFPCHTNDNQKKGGGEETPTD